MKSIILANNCYSKIVLQKKWNEIGCWFLLLKSQVDEANTFDNWVSHGIHLINRNLTYDIQIYLTSGITKLSV